MNFTICIICFGTCYRRVSFCMNMLMVYNALCQASTRRFGYLLVQTTPVGSSLGTSENQGSRFKASKLATPELHTTFPPLCTSPSLLPSIMLFDKPAPHRVGTTKIVVLSSLRMAFRTIFLTFPVLRADPSYGASVAVSQLLPMVMSVGSVPMRRYASPSPSQ